MKQRIGKRGDPKRLRLGLPALFLLALVMPAGCGGGSTTVSTVPSSPAAVSTQGSAAGVNAVAFVSRTPISKAGYEHWFAVERALGGSSNPSHQALAFLITSQWVVGEAAARKISVSEAEIKQHLAQLKKQSFSKPGSFEKFLAKSAQTEADLLARVKIELLESRIAAQVAAGKSGSRSTALLTSFQKAFETHWKHYTTCKPGYVMEDCSEFRGKPEVLTSTSSSSSSRSSGSSSSSTRTPSSSSSNSSGELPPPLAGAMAISSPAFELNGEIPKQYTCDGANISPPLEWKNIPSKAAALVLFVIDDTSTGSASGIRWVVGDIDPSSKGVAAGHTPEGAVVGADSQGHAGYGGICPPHGKTSTIEFVLYALSKKISLSSGFLPTVAESEYGSAKLLLGSAAVTYAVYHRP